MARVIDYVNQTTVCHVKHINEHENWWKNRSVTQRNLYMLEHAKDTDVTFLFQNNTETNTSPDTTSTKMEHSDDEFQDCPQEPGKHALSEHTSLQTENTDQRDDIDVTMSCAARSDTTPICDVSIEAHKYMLLSASSVLWKLIQENHAADDITIRDVEPGIFKLMLRFVYTDETDINEHTVVPLLRASQLYDISALTTKCSEWLANQVNSSNACILLAKSLELKRDALAQKCLEVIQNQTSEALATDVFVDIPQEALCYIVNSDRLAISEVDVFQYCITWARHQLTTQSTAVNGSGIRQVLGPVLFSIRFPTFTLQDFSSIVVPAEILNKEEELAIFRHLSMPEHARAQGDSNPPMPFPTEKRHFIRMKKAVPATTTQIAAADDVKSQDSLSSPLKRTKPSCSKTTKRSLSNSEEESQARKKMKASSVPGETLVLDEAGMTAIRMKELESPSVFSLELHKATEPMMVQSLRLSAPIIEQTAHADPPTVSIISANSNEKLLYKYPLDLKSTAFHDGVAYHDVWVQPFWLLPTEKNQLKIIYSVPENETSGSQSQSFIRRVFGSKIAKAAASSASTYNVQVLDTSAILGNGKKRVLVETTQFSPLMGLTCERT